MLTLSWGWLGDVISITYDDSLCPGVPGCSFCGHRGAQRIGVSRAGAGTDRAVLGGGFGGKHAVDPALSPSPPLADPPLVSTGPAAADPQTRSDVCTMRALMYLRPVAVNQAPVIGDRVATALEQAIRDAAQRSAADPRLEGSVPGPWRLPAAGDATPLGSARLRWGPRSRRGSNIA